MPPKAQPTLHQQLLTRIARIDRTLSNIQLELPTVSQVNTIIERLEQILLDFDLEDTGGLLTTLTEQQAETNELLRRIEDSLTQIAEHITPLKPMPVGRWHRDNKKTEVPPGVQTLRRLQAKRGSHQ